jgi:uncharacterized protein YdeI (YjbR/CyaY-like superfamily)
LNTLFINGSLPREFEHALQASKRARENFQRLAPSHKRQYIYWIATAKRDVTRQRRIDAAIKMLKENKRLGIDTRMTDQRGTGQR